MDEKVRSETVGSHDLPRKEASVDILTQNKKPSGDRIDSYPEKTPATLKGPFLVPGELHCGYPTLLQNLYSPPLK